MDPGTASGCVALIVLSSWLGTRRDLAYAVGLVAAALGLVLAHVFLLREANLFQQIQAVPDPMSSLSVRVAIRKLEREGNQENLVNAAKAYLVRDDLRIIYMTHGIRGLMSITDDIPKSVFYFRVYGPPLLWYACAFLVVFGFFSSRLGKGSLGWGIFILAGMILVEVAEKNFENLVTFRWLPYDTPYDTVELCRVLATCLFAVTVYLFSFENDDIKLYAYHSAQRIISHNEKLVRQD